MVTDAAAAGHNRVRRDSVIQTTILLVQGIALLMGVVYIACGKISYIMAYDAYTPDKKVYFSVLHETEFFFNIDNQEPFLFIFINAIDAYSFRINCLCRDEAIHWHVYPWYCTHPTMLCCVVKSNSSPHRSLLVFC